MTAAFDVLVVTVGDLPAYTPHLEGTVEGLNRSVERMFLAALPGYVRQPRPGKRPGCPKGEVLLGFEVFTARLLAWVQWWNTVHQPAPLGGKTPLQAWQADPTLLREVGAQELWTFTLEDDGRPRVLSTRGVRFRKRDYVGPWMSGQAGLKVRVRFMPYRDHRIEVFDADTGGYLGPADVSRSSVYRMSAGEAPSQTGWKRGTVSRTSARERRMNRCQMKMREESVGSRRSTVCAPAPSTKMIAMRVEGSSQR
ncbi:Mu transposase C-terminal domain-containing protein [Streptomyces sp. LN590]|uniref:Mu transposase C-terminal domain-containing protein n=1 Tax=Streptomyces sp. LN590 TaxID=3112980 RepID=UPI00370FAFC1